VAKFNWVAFLNRYRVPYNTRGPNTPSNAITVHCPFCGDQDPSDHMVLWGRGWRCWRNHSHRGGHPAKLVQALIRCSTAEAQRITGEVTIASPNDLSSVADFLTKPAARVARKLSFPRELRPLKDEWACKPFLTYLCARGFVDSAEFLHAQYGLRYCLRGPFSGRIIFPVMHAGDLISWTGRTIYPAEELRYKSLTTDAEAATKQGIEPAVAPINQYLMWHDLVACSRAKTFVLVEGPFDALKVNVLGRPDVVSTCWTGSEPTQAQIKVLHRLVRPFTRRIVISDSDMPQKAERIANRLRSLAFEACFLPAGVKDPGDLRSTKQLLSMLAR
jgi:hypothetical protein